MRDTGTSTTSSSNSSHRRSGGTSSRANVNGNLTVQHETLLTRDRALQLKLDPSLRHKFAEERLVRTGVDALLPEPWPASARAHEHWLFLLSLLAVLSGFITPFRIAFLTPGVHGGVSAWELFCDILFCVNMAVYATCVLPPNQPDATRREIAVKYLTSTFLTRDVFAALPFDYIAFSAGLRNGDALFMLGLMRLRRLRRTFEMMASYEADLRLPYFALRAFRFTLYALLHVHGFACAFAFLARREGGFQNWLAVAQEAKPWVPVQHNIWAQYLVSLYWATVTFCGVGYGDLTPQTSHEFIFVVCYMLANFALSAYVVGNMSSMATAQEAGTRLFREQTADMEAFFAAHKLPPVLCESLRQCMQLRQNDARDHREVLQIFPPVLRRKCQRFLYFPMIRDVYIFEKTPPTFARVLSTIVTVELFLPGTAVLTQGLPAFDMFIITSGMAEYVLRPTACAADENDELWGADSCSGEAFDCVSIGDCIGEAPFVFRLVNPWSVRAYTLMRTLCLNRDHWKSIKTSRPDFAALVEDSIAEHIARMAIEDAEVPESPWPAFGKLVQKEHCSLRDARCSKPSMPAANSAADMFQPSVEEQSIRRMSVASLATARLTPMRGD